jgi:hypothetical protein
MESVSGSVKATTRLHNTNNLLEKKYKQMDSFSKEEPGNLQSPIQDMFSGKLQSIYLCKVCLTDVKKDTEFSCFKLNALRKDKISNIKENRKAYSHFLSKSISSSKYSSKLNSIRTIFQIFYNRSIGLSVQFSCSARG